MGLPFTLYFVLSIIAGAATISYACYTREQFYPIILFLVTSKLSFLVAVNVVIAFAIGFGKFLKSLFFGSLRDTEVEQLVERCKYSAMETCLALTIFRHELTPFVLLLFGLLLFTKVFHWLCRGRIDYLEQVVPVPLFTHIRLQLLLLSLLVVDSFVAFRCIDATIVAGNKSVLLLFGFEFVVLLIGAFNYAVRYILLAADSIRENGLQYKGFYIMILDILCDGLKFVIYVAFFSLVFVHYGLPIHIVREVWMCFLTFQQRLASFIRYMRLTRRLDERLQDATPEEIEHAGNCLICREAMTSGKKLHCSHVFHIDCLRMWLQHQQSCPLCRTEILDSQPTIPVTHAADAAVARAVAEANAADDEAAVLNQGAENNLPAARPATTPLRCRPDDEASVPGFFMVMSESILLYASPSLVSLSITTYSKNHVLFSTARLHISDTDTWLRVPDGWVLEKSSANVCPNLIPVTMTQLMESNRKSARPIQKKIGLMNMRKEQLLSKENVISGAQNRVEKILALQRQVESMAATILTVQESIVITQCFISRLLEEESSVPIKDATADVEKSHLKDASPASSILAGVSSSLNTPKSDADAAIVGETSVQKSVRELRSAYFVEKKAACKNEDDTGGADETGV